MKRPDTYTVSSLFIGSLSLIGAIIAGFYDSKVASIACTIGLGFTWVTWITVKVIFLENKIKQSPNLSNSVSLTQDNPRCPAIAPIPYFPKFQFLLEKPLLIDNSKKKVKIPPTFLEWKKFTILFWVKITPEFFDTKNNRYLFSYTTDPSMKQKCPQYPNAFFLGIVGGTMNWRFILKGQDPQNETKIIFSTHEGLKGWKFFSIRWETHSDVIKFDIDGGRVYSAKRSASKGSRPAALPDHLFHLGGWQDTWAGGLALLEFFNFRVFDAYLTDGEVLDLFEAEKSAV
jgi:hypothetical protein